MNRIASRAWVTWFLIAVLLGGTGLFVYEYLVHGENWVLSPGSPHIYDDHGKVTGTIVDRNGVLLLDQRDGGTYAQQELLRQFAASMGDLDGEAGKTIFGRKKKDK